MCVGGGAQISAQGHAQLGTMVSTKRTVVLYLGTLCMEVIRLCNSSPIKKQKNKALRRLRLCNGKKHTCKKGTRFDTGRCEGPLNIRNGHILHYQALGSGPLLGRQSAAAHSCVCSSAWPPWHSPQPEHVCFLLHLSAHEVFWKK